MNKCIFSGRITRDLELNYSASGGQQAICRFTLAVRRARNVPEGAQDTDFVSCVCFGKIAENLVKFCHKGSKIELCGKFQSSEWTDKNGVKQYGYSVLCEDIQYLDPKPQPQPAQPTQQQGQPAPQAKPTQPQQMPPQGQPQPAPQVYAPIPDIDPNNLGFI
jgi:single-strand DNA-binding protein